jgi:hypothetical protein
MKAEVTESASVKIVCTHCVGGEMLVSGCKGDGTTGYILDFTCNNCKFMEHATSPDLINVDLPLTK